MARAAGAKKVYFASASQPVRFPNVYGIDMPTRGELIATGRTDAQIAALIGADELIYQDLDALEASVRECNPRIHQFDASCFNGCYITGDVDEAYLDNVERARNQKPLNTAGQDDEDESGNAAQQIEMFIRRPEQ
jgi:amidophosphoribosyltransferase